MNLFFGYDLRDYKKVDEILARHIKKFGMPPSILVNKVDSASIPKYLGAEVDKYVLPNSILLEIPEVMSPDEYPLYNQHLDD